MRDKNARLVESRQRQHTPIVRHSHDAIIHFNAHRGDKIPNLESPTSAERAALSKMPPDVVSNLEMWAERANSQTKQEMEEVDPKALWVFLDHLMSTMSAEELELTLWVDPLIGRSSNVSWATTSSTSTIPHTSNHKRPVEIYEEHRPTLTTTQPFPVANTTSASVSTVTDPTFCIICEEDFTPEFTPPAWITLACEHTPTICKKCMTRSIASDLENKIWNQIACPECPALLEYEDIRRLADAESFAR